MLSYGVGYSLYNGDMYDGIYTVANPMIGVSLTLGPKGAS